MSLLVVALLVAAPDHIDPSVRLPVVDLPKATAAPRAALTINLTRHGQLRVHTRPAGGKLDNKIDEYLRDADKPALKHMTLDDLATHLFTSKRLHDLRQKIQKMQGRKPAPFWIDIRADRDAPWGHVLWILTVCAESRCQALRIAALRPDKTPALIDASLPADLPPRDLKEKPLHKLPVVVSILATGEKQAQWGPPGAQGKALLPTAVRFGYAHRWYDWKSGWEKPTGKPALQHWLKAAHALAKDPTFVSMGEIWASEKVPVQHVVNVLALFRSGGYRHVGFYGTKLHAGTRKLANLPYPVRNRIPDTEPEPDLGIEDD